MINQQEILRIHKRLEMVAMELGHKLSPVDTFTRVWVTGKTSSGKSSFVNDYLGQAALATGKRLCQPDEALLIVSRGDSHNNTSSSKYVDTMPESLVISESCTEVPEREVDLVIFFVDSTAALEPASLQRFVGISGPKVMVMGKFDTVTSEVEKIFAVAEITWSLSTLRLPQQPRIFLFSSVEKDAAWNMRKEIFEQVKFANNEKLLKSRKSLADQTRQMIVKIDAALTLNEKNKLNAQRIERSTGTLVHVAFGMQSVSVGALLFAGDEVWKFQAVVAVLVLSLVILGVVAILRRFRAEILPGTRTAALLDHKAELERICGLINH